MKKGKNVLKQVLFGVVTGAVNGAFGAGGGMVVVPFLKKLGLDQKKAQQNAVAIILPITLLSAIIYMVKGYVKISDCLIFLPTGLLGAFCGTAIIKKISPLYLKIAFGGFMIWAGIRTVIR